MAGAALTAGGSGTKKHRQSEAEWRGPPFGEFARMGVNGTVQDGLPSRILPPLPIRGGT